MRIDSSATWSYRYRSSGYCLKKIRALEFVVLFVLLKTGYTRLCSCGGLYFHDNF